jgi:hypothetical protein
MKKFISILLTLLFLGSLHAQVVSLRVVQVSYSSLDPDGGGPATGAVLMRFEVMSTIPVYADGIGLSFVFQSTKLMAPPLTNNTVLLGPLAPSSAPGWVQGVDNRAGTPITPIVYGGQTFDSRMLITFNQAKGTPNALIGTSWTAVAMVEYWTKGLTTPEGGYVVNQPGAIVSQIELSSDGGLSTYPLVSPNLETPTPLGSVAVPVSFTRFDAKCNSNGTLISWSTAQESNSRNFEIQKSADGTGWEAIANVPAAGNSATTRNYQQLDLAGGAAFYRIKQVNTDGQFVYSNIERTDCEVRNISSVIYPIPARDVLNVVIKWDRAAKTRLLVYEITGRFVQTTDADIIKGNNTFKINTTGLAAGDYILKSSNPDIVLNKIFTVVNR